jgi:hypothetical protein
MEWWSTFYGICFIGKEYGTCQKFYLVGFSLSSCLLKFKLGLFSCVLFVKGRRKRNGTVAPVKKQNAYFNHCASSSYHHRSVHHWRAVIARKWWFIDPTSVQSPINAYGICGG